MLRTRQISHYTSDGMKPYMEYTLFGGKGYVAQNVGYDGFTLLPCAFIKSFWLLGGRGEFAIFFWIAKKGSRIPSFSFSCLF
jgi:hypothetical protein